MIQLELCLPQFCNYKRILRHWCDETVKYGKTDMRAEISNQWYKSRNQHRILQVLLHNTLHSCLAWSSHTRPLGSCAGMQAGQVWSISVHVARQIFLSSCHYLFGVAPPQSTFSLFLTSKELRKIRDDPQCFDSRISGVNLSHQN